ncbi:MAG: chlorhexidine efflux transporter [Pseudomonadota bacterium]
MQRAVQERSVRERAVQALLFEAGGLLVAVPLYNCVFGRSARESFVLMAALAIVVLIWTPLHNWLFDHAEHRLTGRSASDRPHHLRLLHAFTHELTPIAATLPLIMGLGQHSLREALAVNVGLTAVYMGYAYGFYLIYDRLRPLRDTCADDTTPAVAPPHHQMSPLRSA